MSQHQDHSAHYIFVSDATRLVLPDRPTTLSVLQVLTDCGAAGAHASEIARLYKEPESVQRRNSIVNQVLIRLSERGHTYRTTKPEASHYRNHVPVYRWWITASGTEYMRAGGYAGVRAVRSVPRRDYEARVTHERAVRSMIVRGLPAIVAAMPDCMIERQRLIMTLRSKKVTLSDIGNALGISRERVRQIMHADSIASCKCVRCQARDDVKARESL